MITLNISYHISCTDLQSFNAQVAVLEKLGVYNIRSSIDRDALGIKAVVYGCYDLNDNLALEPNVKAVKIK